MKTLKDIQHLEGVKVLVRADFNVPILNGVISDDFRIRAALPTIDFLTSKGAKVILISHAEASDGSNNSLEPVVHHLTKTGREVIFVKNIRNAQAVIENELKNGTCVLLENLRMFGDGEKKNDSQFAKELASFADIYVNEAFPVSHRVHASVVGVPALLPGYAGLQFEKEVTHLSKAFTPAHPFLFVLGGAKFETKLPLIEKFLEVADQVFICGALANDLLKIKGWEVGRSLVSDNGLDLTPVAHNPKVILPIDVVVESKGVKRKGEVLPSEKILDAGPATIEILKDVIAQAKFILWNGTLGLCEQGYAEGTEAFAKLVTDATSRGVESIVGGGDTVAALSKDGLQDKFTFVSTGGGAMLDFLAKGTLPGIQAMAKSEIE